MKEAFAQSCNSYFMQLGQTTGAEDICRMAKRFGLGKKALEAYPQQCSGHVMTTRECSGAGIGNLSIGQGQTLVTPLQIARMTSIIATGGIDRGTHILLSERSGETRVVSVQTASADPGDDGEGDGNRDGVAAGTYGGKRKGGCSSQDRNGAVRQAGRK